jgi:hypothetical protein
MLKVAMRVMSYGVRVKARRHRVNYSFLFMRANGDQLDEITALIESGIIRPVVDRVFPFDSTNEGVAQSRRRARNPLPNLLFTSPILRRSLRLPPHRYGDQRTQPFQRGRQP